MRLIINIWSDMRTTGYLLVQGALREAYIRQFLTEVVPHGSELIGGFVTDACGSITPQIDLIGIEDILPIIKLDKGTCVAPVEATRFWIEVKSLLKTSHLQPIVDRLATVDSMVWHLLQQNNPIGFKLEFRPPAFVVAYDTDVKKETLKKWLTDNRFLISIVVVGKYALWNLDGNGDSVEEIHSCGASEELLFLSAKIHQMFVLSSRITEQFRAKIAKLPLNPTEEDLRQLKSENRLDMVHFSLQPYFESEKLKQGT